MRTERSDAIVVGGGPAGAATAIMLSRLGHDVVLLDRMHFPRSKPCGEYMSPGVALTLERLGLLHALSPVVPRNVTGMDIVAPSGTTLSMRYSSDGQPRSAITLMRRDLDSQLIQLAVESRVRVLQGVPARRPLLKDGKVAGVLASDAGDDVTFTAPLTIAADGAQSVLARGIGLSAPPRWPRRLGLVAHFREQPGVIRESGEMHVDHEGYCGIAPLPDGYLNVAMVLREDAVRRSAGTATDLFDRWIERHPALRSALKGAKRVTPVRGVARIGSRAVRPWHPGALLVGDAAGFFDPFTGEGIYRALNGAELAALVAHEALTRGDAGGARLQVYERLRRERFRDKQLVTTLVQLFVQYPRMMQYALPRLSRRPGPYAALSGALGDLADPRRFLQPGTLWGALHP